MRKAKWVRVLPSAAALIAGVVLVLAVAARATFHAWTFLAWPPMVGFAGRRYDLTAACAPAKDTPGLRYVGNALWFPVYTDAAQWEAHRTRQWVIMGIYLRRWGRVCSYTIEGGP